MTVRGTWHPDLVVDLNRAVEKSLCEHPAALIVDLASLDDPGAGSVHTWVHAWRLSQELDPPVEVLLCAPPEAAVAQRLRRMGAARFLPVYGTADQARAARAAGLGLPHSLHRLRLRLPQRTDSAYLARNLVSDACEAWGLQALRDRGRLVVSELAGNAIRHARPPLTVVVSRRATGLHLVVADGDPRLPRALTSRPPPEREATRPISDAGLRGQGLRVVEAAATKWGVMPAGDGKMVWATVYPWVRRR
ncbi:ATP-binding protein [Pseudosporangium ferrugineum]|uniref:Histidine kinase-like protein n=1 Tax=Pseudosporangium ferrugineum TaxID=439699 RepID=A0A2T0SDV2_9ACTN|nr:ATP-binding protein [Pseudosporangium ferrugineum]PRY31590.1 histidine kinase-like protein [Pseudosporangium ferrugineum]